MEGVIFRCVSISSTRRVTHSVCLSVPKMQIRKFSSIPDHSNPSWPYKNLTKPSQTLTKPLPNPYQTQPNPYQTLNRTKYIPNTYQTHTKSLPKPYQIKSFQTLLNCYQTVTKPLPNCYQTVTIPLPNRYQTVTKLLPNCYQTVTKLLPNRYQTIIKPSPNPSRTPTQPQRNPNLTITQLELGLTRIWLFTTILLQCTPPYCHSVPHRNYNIASEQCRAILSYLGMFW